MGSKANLIYPIHQGVFKGTLSNFKSIPLQVTDRLINILTPRSLNEFLTFSIRYGFGRDAINLLLELLVYSASPKVYGRISNRSVDEIIEMANFYWFNCDEQSLNEKEYSLLRDYATRIMEELSASYVELLEDGLLDNQHSVLLEFADRFNLSLRLTVRVGS